MPFRQIVGFVLLFFFSGFMAYKFYHYVSGQQDAILITALAIVILIFLILIIRKIILEA